MILFYLLFSFFSFFLSFFEIFLKFFCINLSTTPWFALFFFFFFFFFFTPYHLYSLDYSTLTSSCLYLFIYLFYFIFFIGTMSHNVEVVQTLSTEGSSLFYHMICKYGWYGVRWLSCFSSRFNALLQVQS